MIYKFIIDQRVPGMNELINANRTNKYVGAKMKKETEEMISFYIYNAVNNGLLKPIQDACIVNITWCERTKKRDSDNIQSGQKFILDALQKTNIIPNDSQRYVKWTYPYLQHTDHDYVIVEIVEVA